MNIPQKGKGVTYNQTTTPGYPSISDTWFNPTDGCVRQWDGYSWKYVIGPSGDSQLGSGFIIAGGSTGSTTSTIEHIPFASDSGSYVHGNMITACYNNMACNSSLYSYVHNGATSSSVWLSSIEKFSNSSQNSNSRLNGNLATTKLDTTSFNSSTYGYFQGGELSAAANSITTDTILFSGETAAAGGNLNNSRSRCGSFNSTLYGFCCAGWQSGLASYFSSTERSAFPFTAGTAYVGGNIASSGYVCCSNINSSLAGYLNYYNGSSISNIVKIVFPFDNGSSSSQAGYMTATLNATVSAGFNSSLCGYVAGGYVSNILTTIQKMTFSTEGTMINVGSTTYSHWQTCGSDTTDFVSGRLFA